MKIPFFKRASFWHLVIQSGQIALAAAQGITLAADVQHVWNYSLAGCSALLGIISLWTKDENRNGVVDIAEPEIEITVTSSSPVNVTTELTPKPEL